MSLFFFLLHSTSNSMRKRKARVCTLNIMRIQIVEYRGFGRLMYKLPTTLFIKDQAYFNYNINTRNCT